MREYIIRGRGHVNFGHGTDEQKKKWLIPLINQEMESGFSMTEPDSAGSDPRSLKTTAVREGDEWVINGHKIMTSNGNRADFLVVMCKTEDDGDEGTTSRICFFGLRNSY